MMKANTMLIRTKSVLVGNSSTNEFESLIRTRNRENWHLVTGTRSVSIDYTIANLKQFLVKFVFKTFN